MTSRIPPVSPASIMFVVRSSKTAGYWRMALARVEPPSTVVRTPVSVFWKDWLSWLAAKISRHCTSGNPASIMTENWRKKIAMSLVLTLPEPKVGMENSLPFSRIAPGVIRSRRNCCPSACLLGEFRSPEIFCPEASLPENVNTGMVLISPQLVVGLLIFIRCPITHFLALRCCRTGRGRRAAPVCQSCAPVNHFLKFVRIAGALQRYLQRDLLLEISCGQRL